MPMRLQRHVDTSQMQVHVARPRRHTHAGPELAGAGAGHAAPGKRGEPGHQRGRDQGPQEGGAPLAAPFAYFCATSAPVCTTPCQPTFAPAAIYKLFPQYVYRCSGTTLHSRAACRMMMGWAQQRLQCDPRLAQQLTARFVTLLDSIPLFCRVCVAAAGSERGGGSAGGAEPVRCAVPLRHGPRPAAGAVHSGMLGPS